MNRVRCIICESETPDIFVVRYKKAMVALVMCCKRCKPTAQEWALDTLKLALKQCDTVLASADEENLTLGKWTDD